MSPESLPPGFLDRLAGVYRIEQDKQIGRLAVRRRLITKDQFEMAVKELELAGPGRPLGAYFLDRNLIAPQVLELLKAEVGAEDAAPGSKPSLPPEVQVAAEAPVNLVAEFVLVSILGRGGAGEVWKAWDRQLGRWVAVKFPRLSRNSALLAQRFLREAQAVARLTHPSIVPIYRVDSVGDRPFIVMPHIDGKSLDEFPLSVPEALRVMLEMANAVSYAHGQGVVHRDIKPANIMVNDKGAAWLLDFGLAHIHEEGSLTASGLVLGTPQFMSPEQARSLPAARHPATDVYALGATLYFLVTQSPPFSGATFAEVVRKVAYEDPLPPKHFNPSLPRDVSTVILKAMEKEPSRRYATAAEFAEDIGRCLTGEPVRARSVTGFERVWRQGWRHRAFVLGAVLLVSAGAWILSALKTARVREDRQNSALVEKEQAARKAESLNEAHVLLNRARAPIERAMQIYYHESADFELARKGVTGAQTWVNQAIGKAPDLAEGHYWAGLAAKFLGSPGAAEESLRKAIACDSSHGMAHFQLGKILAERAVELAAIRNRISPNDPEVRRLAEESEREFRTAVTTHPDLMANTEGALAYLLKIRTGHDRRTILSELVQLVENAQLQGRPGMEELFLMLALDSGGDQQFKLVDKALAMRPHFPLALVARGGFRAQSGDYAGAIADYDHVLVIEPASKMALRQRALTYKAWNKPDEAIRDCTRLIELGKGDADIHEIRGQLWCELQKFPECVADWRKSLDLNPDQARTWQKLCSVLTVMGDREAAMQAVNKALEIDPSLVLAYNSRAMLKATLFNDWEGGLPDLEKAVALRPDFEEGHLNLGKYYARLGRHAEAIRSFEECLKVARPDWTNRGTVPGLIEASRRATAEPR